MAGLEHESRLCADSAVESDAATKELFDLLDAHVPLDLRADFLRMRAGEPVPKVRRERVLQAARDIVDDPRRFHAPSTDAPLEENVFAPFDNDDGE